MTDIEDKTSTMHPEALITRETQKMMLSSQNDLQWFVADDYYRLKRDAHRSWASCTQSS